MAPKLRTPKATEACGKLSDETLHPEPDEKAGGSNGSGAVGSGAAAARRLRPLGQSEPTEMETCPICLDVLCCQPLGVCVDSCGRRSCGHFFHLSCLERVEGAHCPQCRTRFTLRAPVPNLGDAWVRLVAPQGLRRDVAAGLRACLELPHEEVDRLLSPASDVLEPDVLAELLQVAQDFLPKSLEEIPAKEPPPEGCRCLCGRLHLRRGDRVCAGPSKDAGVPEGYLGSIARLMEGGVLVKWDRHPKARRYPWPAQDSAVLRPASLLDLDPEVAKLVELTVQPSRGTGLSSAAAEELLHAEPGTTLEVLAQRGLELGEERLRRTPALYHRVRLLPDTRLVQQWFDRSRPCQCNRPGCCGGVMWSSRAEKHLGREGLVLQIDPSDDTVLVETFGPCDCKIWYPRLAVTPVYDPDLEEEPQFQVDDCVECKMQSGWERGMVKEVLWRGSRRCGPVPYTVTLLNGSSIFVPHVNLIRKADA